MASGVMIFILNLMTIGFRSLNNIKDIALKFWDSTVLVVLTRRMYDIGHFGGFILNVPSFMRTGTGIQAIYRYASETWKAVKLVLLMETIYE